MILDLTFEEIDKLLKVLHRTNKNGRDAMLLDLEARLEVICGQHYIPIASAAETEVRNDRGHGKGWYRTVEVMIAAEVTYLFRVKAEHLVSSATLSDALGSVNDGTTTLPAFPSLRIYEHWILLGPNEYRSTQPPPAEVLAKALDAFAGISAWMRDAGLTEESVRREW